MTAPPPRRLAAPPRPPHKPPRGAALLAAMVTVTLVATLAAAALWRHWRGVEVERAERARVQSAWLLTGALDWGRLVLTGDLVEDNRNRQRGTQPADHLGEPWAVPLAEARLSTFLAMGEQADAADADSPSFLSGQVRDLQSRLNLMNLIAEDARRIGALERFGRLFELLRLPQSELGALQRALDRADHALKGQQPGGGNAPLMPRRFEQLAWLGVKPATLAALRPHATLLPLSRGAITPVNLNTASAQVIYAALPGIDLAGAQRLVQARDGNALRSLDDARQAGRLADHVDTTWASLTSEFFEVRGRLRLDDVALEEVAVVQRQNRRAQVQVRTLWRERTALTVDEETAP